MPVSRFFSLAILLLCAFPLLGQSVRLSLALDRDIYRDSVQNNLYLKATIHVEADPLSPSERSDFVFLVDRSGSMEGEKLEQTKRALKHAFSLLSSDDTASVVSFGSAVETLITRTPVDQLSAHTSAIENLSSEGGSSLYAGLETALASLRHNNSDTSAPHIILITDGPPNKGPRDAESFKSLFSSLNRQSISFTTLFLAENATASEREGLLSLLPNEPIFVETPAKLTGSITASLHKENRIIGRNAVLDIKFVSGIEIEESIGRESTISGRSLRFTFGDLREKQALTALVQATISANKTTFSRSRIASATLQYSPVDQNESAPASITQLIEASFVPSASASFESIHTHVYQSVCEGEVSDTLRESNEWIQQGRIKKALRELKKLSRNIRNVANDLSELQVDAQINQLNKAIQQIETTRDSSIEKAAQIETLYPSASSLSAE